jgi:hypothetical protein
MTLLIQDVAVLIYQQNHMTWPSMIARDKTVAMTLSDKNIHISTQNGHDYIIIASN